MPRRPREVCSVPTCRKVLLKWKVGPNGVIKCLACRRASRAQRREAIRVERDKRRTERARLRAERLAKRSAVVLPDGGSYIIRKEGSGKDATEAITSRSGKGIKVFKAGSRLAPRNVGWLFRWGWTGEAPPATGVVNEARAIALTSDKTKFRILLNEKGLCPKTWTTEADVVCPAIVRPRHHMGGKDVILVKDAGELRAAINRVGAGWYAATYIDKVEEYRIFVVSGRAGWVAKKIPPAAHSVAWNHTFGSKFENVRFDSWPLKAVKTAIEGFNLSGLDFGAVDVIVDKDGKPYVLEINTAIALESPYRSGAVAKCFDYIVEKGKGTIPLADKKGGWRKFAHPSLADGVLV